MADQTDASSSSDPETPADDAADAAGTAEGATDEGATADADAGALEQEASTPAKATGTSAKAKPAAKAKGKATEGKATEAEPAERTVTRRQVTSKRVTPKGGAKVAPTGPKKAGSSAADADEPSFSRRYTPPSQGAYAQGPSPVWVPVLMFALLILGAACIVANYAGLFGSADNIYLVVGLGLILGGIITATQYR